ncbi:hypothetical protein SAMN02745121_00267 [Nannocystis exedens]|uniref:Uncharacterized protein n=1 Tax=Nannocystis exedens TaxID=54 RepID=A0A1I1STX1_9BACT|nr:hypothetical protein NAEX_08840 [Nannocystis exedens]SFD49897.1 hypothetical protein SAMN02745121_00267 [Nannocystis exedens]
MGPADWYSAGPYEKRVKESPCLLVPRTVRALRHRRKNLARARNDLGLYVFAVACISVAVVLALRPNDGGPHSRATCDVTVLGEQAEVDVHCR